MIRFILLINRQGKTRLSRWYITLPNKDKNRITRDATMIVMNRTQKMTNVVDHKDVKIIYRRYASLFFIAGVDAEDNELITLETIHRYVELLDRYFGNVCELDIIYSFDRCCYVLDELVVGGEVVETSKKAALRAVAQMDMLADRQDDEQEEPMQQARYSNY